jgi:hypothetical protein
MILGTANYERSRREAPAASRKGGVWGPHEIEVRRTGTEVMCRTFGARFHRPPNPGLTAGAIACRLFEAPILGKPC